MVFDRPIGQNQGVQFPIARAHIAVESADLMRRQASARFDASLSCGAEANMAKLLASEASWQAANACLDTFGGNGFAACVTKLPGVPNPWAVADFSSTSPIGHFA